MIKPEKCASVNVCVVEELGLNLLLKHLEHLYSYP